MWLLGNAVCWLGMGMAPQSVLAVMDCWNIVVALAVSPWCFGEKVSRQTCWAASLLVIGCLWVITFGPKSYQPQTVDRLIEQGTSHEFIYCVLASVSFLASMAYTAYNNWHKAPSLTPFQFSMLSATFAWFATILSKSTAALILTSVTTASSGLQNGIFTLFVFGFVVCAACQIHFLNLGMKYGDAVIVIPAYMAMSTLGQIVLGGVVFFQEFNGLGLAAHAWFWPGVMTVLIGVASLPNQDQLTDKNEQTPLMQKTVTA